MQQDPFVARRYYLKDVPDAVEVRVHRPEADDVDYFCRVEIDGLASPVRKKAYGVDAMQALLLGLSMAKTCLTASCEFKRGEIGWFEPGDSDSGIEAHF
ncbi:DUF6968 family protein [Rhodovulum sp. DZ06]|uniref:DUF6968 family protein n=1 Tax=Rhodovulum sp. DZ06 TaxID=3425126 RepID=UPI003D342757